VWSANAASASFGLNSEPTIGVAAATVARPFINSLLELESFERNPFLLSIFDIMFIPLILVFDNIVLIKTTVYKILLHFYNSYKEKKLKYL
jgi:hypothetical protein